MKSIYYVIPLVNFFVAALFGLLLRVMFVTPLEKINFSYLLHGHSHIALLGWLFLCFYVLYVTKFSVQTGCEQQFYKRLFWCLQLTVVGMALSFPLVGYSVVSICFSTLHIICAYVFVYRLWRNNIVHGTQQGVLLKTSLFFMMFSTLGVWFLGPAVGVFGKASVFYQLCLQFFLHFQFDGWFLTAFLTLLFSTLLKGVRIVNFKSMYFAWICSIVLTYALPLSWYLELPFLYYLTIIGILFQVYAIGCLVMPIYKTITTFDFSLNSTLISLLGVSLFCFGIRVLFQLSLLSPVFASEVQSIRSWIVGFLHLTMLGILSGFGLWLFFKEKVVQQDLWIKLGIVLFVVGFGFTEIILLLQGVSIYTTNLPTFNLSVLLLILSTLLPLSILCFLLSYFKELLK